jgi:hypothetical protein
MFVWMSALLTLVLFPFTLPFGRPKKLTTSGAYLTSELRKRFPWSSKTPMVAISPWPWFTRFMERKGVAAYTFASFIAFRLDRRSTAVHEAIHVTHQSVISPVLYGLAYLLDWLVFAPFKNYFPEGEYKRAPVAEKVAYFVTDVAMNQVDRPFDP